MAIRLQERGFDVGAELNAFSAAQKNSGAVVSFSGVVRDIQAGLDYMEIEHYPAMAERALQTIADEAATRWALEDTLIIHRYGRLFAGEIIMMVATSARHRSDAFEAAEFLMDYLKSRAPFWKKEVLRENSAHNSEANLKPGSSQSPFARQWVAARAEDETALARWEDRENSGLN